MSLKISSLDAEPGSEARELAGSIPRCRDGQGQLQRSQLLLDHLALLLSVFCSSHVHRQQFGTVSAPRGSQELSVVRPHLQHPGQVAALGQEKWHSQIPGFLPGWAPFHWHEGTVPLTNIYFKMLLNKLALQSSPWLASAWLPSNKHGGTKAVLMGFFLCILKDLVPLTNELLAAVGGEKHCNTVRGRVEWAARDGNRGLREEYMYTIEIEIRLFTEKSYGNPAWMWRARCSACHYSTPAWEYTTAGAPGLQGARQDPRADAYTDSTKRLHSLAPLTMVCPYQRSSILNHCRVLPWHWWLYPCGLL